MDLRIEHRIGFGAFSDVFRTPGNDRVYKLFRQRDQNTHLGDDYGEHEPALRRAVFEAERDAYVIAVGVPAIRPYVPAFHGTIPIDRVFSPDNTDISDRYLLDCCYVIDFVDGVPDKLTNNLVQQHPHLQALTAGIVANGINHWSDGGVFHPSLPARTKIIDFATKDAYLEGEMALAGTD